MKIEKAIEIVRAIRPRNLVSEPATPSHTELPGARPNPTGFVYFVYCAGRIKIGFTTNVADRMASLATSSPFPISLLLTIAGDPQDEAALHAAFNHSRANLEWFSLSDDLRAFLEASLCDDGHVILTNAQFDARNDLAQCLADVVNETGGEDGCLVEAAPWPKTLQIADA
jgi:hypothetical protein